MDRREFLKANFETLRDEIKATKARIFWTVAMGLFGVPILIKLAEGSGKFVSLLVPYLVLVVIILFLSEQNALMRAGSYIRQVIEPSVGDAVGWEEWLGTRSELRLMDKHFFACFTLVFYLYYFMAVGAALQLMVPDWDSDMVTKWWMMGTSVTYFLGAIWGLATLLHHWRSCTTTGGSGK